MGAVLHIIQDYKLPEGKEERLAVLKDFNTFIAKNKNIKKMRQEVRTMAKNFVLP